MRKISLLLLLALCFASGISSIGVTNGISIYAGYEGVSDLRNSYSFPLRSAGAFEIEILPMNIVIDSFSIGPVVAATHTTATYAYDRISISGNYGFAIGINAEYRAAEDLSLGLEARTGFGSYDRISIPYASMEGLLKAKYHFNDYFASIKSGVSYKKETLSVICRIGIGMEIK